MNNEASTRHMGKGTWLTIGSPVIAEIASECGFDWLLLDLEHGFISETGVLACLQAAKRDHIKLIVRVPDLDAARIGRVLDWGASGIMLPHVSNAEQAEQCVRAMRYPPQGYRGFSSSVRAFKYGLESPEDLTKWVPPLFIAQIENHEGVRNSESIAAVDGVDVLFVGPADLKLDLSFRTGGNKQTYDEALVEVNRSARRHNKQTGILIRNMADITGLQEHGFTCLALGSDVSFLRNGFMGVLKGCQNDS